MDSIMSKRPIHQYKEEQLTQAMTAIRNGMKIREASRTFGVPRGTLQDRLHLRVPEMPRKMGPDTVLTKADWCIALAKCGFPQEPDNLLNTVQNIISEDNRPNPFVNNRPGKKWYQSFLRRHPELSKRTPENISKGRAAVTEESIRKWFAELLKHLEIKGASDILSMPDRIFNGDETSFYICPKSGKVIAPRGYKNVYKILKGKEKEAITVLLFISASGNTLPPCVVFPYVRPPKDVVNSMPADWLLGKSETGWMKSDIFFYYIVKGLNKWLDDQKIQKPVLVFVDGHKSHLTMRLSEFCNDNGIILYALPPNATHLIQPADVSVFKPLKSEWKKTVHEWATRPENVNNVLTKSTFCPLLKKVLEKENLPTTIINGFRKCGLYPCNPDALDYTKCVQNNLQNYQTQTTDKSKSPGSKLKKRYINTAIKVIKQLSDDFKNAGVDVEIVINVLNVAKDTKGIESLNSTKNSTSNEIEIDNRSSISHADTKQQEVASESVEIPFTSLPIIGDYTLENNLVDITLNDEATKEFEIITDFEVIDHSHNATTVELETVLLNDQQIDNNAASEIGCARNYEVNRVSDIEIEKYLQNETDESEEIVNRNYGLNIKNTGDDKENTTKEDRHYLKNYNTCNKKVIHRENKPKLFDTHNSNNNDTQFIHRKGDQISKKPIILSNVVVKAADLPPVLKTKSENLKKDNNKVTTEQDIPKKDYILCNKQELSKESIPKLIEKKNNKDAEIKDNSNIFEELNLLPSITINSENLSPVLKKHLTLPPITKKTKTVKSLNRIGAISSDEWQQFEKQKEEIREQKRNEILMNKLKRLEAKEKKEEEKRRRQEELRKRKAERSSKTTDAKRRKPQKKAAVTCTVNKIQCHNCDEELNSDTEINDLKNIGCHACPAWYHLRCTEFAGELYDNVSNLKFLCPLCKRMP